MSVSLAVKVLGGVVLTGGAIAVPVLLLKGTSRLENKIEQLPIKDKGKFYLENKFSGCTPLLEDKTRSKDYKQIYLCPLGKDNRFELIYYDKEGGTNEVSKKIKSLKQLTQQNYQHKLIVNLEDLGQRTLDWPSLLFQYTDPQDAEKATLNPEKDCELTKEGDKLFKCNSTWEVIKKKK